MTQQNILSDMSTLVKVPNKILTWLADIENLCIGSAISDAKLQDIDHISLNIGIGVLAVELSTMNCKFIPSKDLKNTIKSALAGEADPVEKHIDQLLVQKLISICEEVV